ncbi:nicotinate-nucleotide adenylyltransferase [Legionella sp. D16C41]|uniref:nicotinate-nucleotide adenylyltransferase n=1 Tax=Legionella sp. D16C41 TaxID=3402688 RepID=UPI003AF5C22D
MANLVIFGGTFDPVHNGHLKVAIKVQQHFHFERFIFLPCKIPVLKNNALATPSQRLDMLKLALKDFNQSDYHFEIDEREINRPAPSYMVTTLEDYRSQLGSSIAISLLMGIDAFTTLPNWYHWEKLLQLANIIVIARPGYLLESTLLRNLLKDKETHDAKLIQTTTHGLIYQFNAGLYDLSSTLIRNQLKQGELKVADLPSSVIQYIKNNQLYQ